MCSGTVHFTSFHLVAYCNYYSWEKAPVLLGSVTNHFCNLTLHALISAPNYSIEVHGSGRREGEKTVNQTTINARRQVHKITSRQNIASDSKQWYLTIILERLIGGGGRKLFSCKGSWPENICWTGCTRACWLCSLACLPLCWVLQTGLWDNAGWMLSGWRDFLACR